MLNSRQTLILIPGIICDEWVWKHQKNHLADVADISVADLRGHRSLAAMASSILQSAPDCFALAGHSMGGRVALEVIRQDKTRVTRLALMDTGVHPKAQAEDAKRQQQNLKAQELGMAAFADDWVPGMLHPDRRNDEKLIAAMRNMVLRMTASNLADQNQAMLTRTDATPVLSEIRCPTMMLCGRQDSYSPLQRHREIRGKIADAYLEIIEDAGHMTTVEQPSSVTDCMRRWLAR